jgi:hypothetical protein
MSSPAGIANVAPQPAAAICPRPYRSARVSLVPETLDQLQCRGRLEPEVCNCEGSHRAGHRCGFGPGSRCMQYRHTLRRSLWRALRRSTLWMARCRHMPLLLRCRSSAGRPSHHGLVPASGRYGKSTREASTRRAPCHRATQQSSLISPSCRDRESRSSRPSPCLWLGPRSWLLP